ncbi:MAG: hypothetical protein SFV54_22500 [Bryobacteraceae bacterium]|nr:hypothetical protein [Bryobacteraceae bacterium]
MNVEAPFFESQVVFNRDQFAVAGGPILITGFAWRAKPGTGSISFALGSVEVFRRRRSIGLTALPRRTG